MLSSLRRVELVILHTMPPAGPAGVCVSVSVSVSVCVSVCVC